LVNEKLLKQSTLENKFFPAQIIMHKWFRHIWKRMQLRGFTE